MPSREEEEPFMAQGGFRGWVNAWVGLPQANPSLSAKVFARAKGIVFIERDWRATLAHPLSLAADSNGEAVAGDTLKRKGD